MKPYDPSKDYCGPGKSWLTKVIDKTPWGVNINRCCYNHDVSYEKGGDGKARARADTRFRRCIEVQFSKKWWIPRFFGRAVARRYFIAVRIFGSAVFNYT